MQDAIFPAKKWSKGPWAGVTGCYAKGTERMRERLAKELVWRSESVKRSAYEAAIVEQYSDAWPGSAESLQRAIVL